MHYSHSSNAVIVRDRHLIIRKIIICYSNALSDKMIRFLVKIYKYKQSYIVYIWNRKEEKIHDLSGFQKDIKI